MWLVVYSLQKKISVVSNSHKGNYGTCVNIFMINVQNLKKNPRIKKK